MSDKCTPDAEYPIKETIEEVPVLGYLGAAVDAETCEKLQRTHVLEVTVTDFNESLKYWEDRFQYRANFGFRYDPETGRKQIYVIETGKAHDSVPSEDAMRKAADTIGKAAEAMNNADIEQHLDNTMAAGRGATPWAPRRVEAALPNPPGDYSDKAPVTEIVVAEDGST